MKPLSRNNLKVIGVMSGTSLDGLDLAAIEFNKTDHWNFSIQAAETVAYPKIWTTSLRNAPAFTSEKLLELHTLYARFIANKITNFTNRLAFSPDLIASHGHTIFHQPEKGFTFQLGNGAEIAAATRITTVSDFRMADVALGGQGAPLVPVGDRLLFGEFDYCLNLGGFANISFEEKGKRIAFDICPVNYILNHFAQKQGIAFDKDGDLGKAGSINNQLLDKLNHIDYYKINPPKSLGREWVEQVFLPVLESETFDVKDKIRTIYEHIAIQIARAANGDGKMLVTGGGAFNCFLIERIALHTKTEIVIPQNDLVNFKEALIFAFLGVLRVNNINNCLASVTGASHDHCCGIISQP